MNREECTCSSWLISMLPTDHVSCLDLSSTVWLLAGPLVSPSTPSDMLTPPIVCAAGDCGPRPSDRYHQTSLQELIRSVTRSKILQDIDPGLFTNSAGATSPQSSALWVPKSAKEVSGGVCESHTGCLNDVFFPQGLLHLFVHQLQASDIQQGLCVPRLGVFSGLGYGLVLGGHSTYIRHRDALPDQGNPQAGKKNNAS